LALSHRHDALCAIGNSSLYLRGVPDGEEDQKTKPTGNGGDSVRAGRRASAPILAHKSQAT